MIKNTKNLCYNIFYLLYKYHNTNQGVFLLKKIFLLIPIILISACGNSTDISSLNKQTSSNNSNSILAKKNQKKILTGKLTVGKDGDLTPGIYNLKAVGDDFGIANANSSNNKDILWAYMASKSGQKKCKEIYGEEEAKIYNNEEILGVVLHEGDSIKLTDISLEFTKTESPKILTGIVTIAEDGDLSPGTYNLRAVGKRFGTVNIDSSTKENILWKHMASVKGKETLKELYPEEKNVEAYIDEVQGIVINEGDSLKITNVSVEFTTVD